MTTKFTPVTTQQLAPVQKNAELDGMIEIVQGLIQQRQSSQDRQFTLGQRDRLISGQGKEDEQSAAKTESHTLFNEYMTKGGHTLKDVENLAITGHLDKNQISAITTSATDYRSDNMKLSDFSKLLPDIRDEKELADAIAETDVNESTAFRLWNEKQQREALLAKAAAGSGSGGKDGGKPATLIQRTNAQDKLNDAERELNVFTTGGLIYTTVEGGKKKDFHALAASGETRDGKAVRGVTVIQKEGWKVKRSTYAYDGKRFYFIDKGKWVPTIPKRDSTKQALRHGYASYIAAKQKVKDLTKTLKVINDAGYEREDGKGDRRNDDLF